MSEDERKIKKYYGEDMMKYCRESFSTILETPKKLPELLLSFFAPNKFLYEDLTKNKKTNLFKNFIYGLIEVENKNIDTNLTAKQLLKSVNYDLYECKTQDDILKFKKYYAKGEAICTFKYNRLNTCYVFFAVKENVDEIKRENFKEIYREDEYGTSVISIQFSRGENNIVSIKNRYNHKVLNPDATFSNNLENIVRGLTKAFEKDYNLNINYNPCSFDMDGYICVDNQKFYKYNLEINGKYYCTNNIIIDKGKVVDIYSHNPEKYILMDYFILNLETKSIELYDTNLKDSFVDEFYDIAYIKIHKSELDNSKEIIITRNDKSNFIIVLDKYNKIIGYENNNIEHVKDNFLYYNKSLKNIKLDNVKHIYNKFLYYNEELTSLYFPKLKIVDDDFVICNNKISKISFNELISVGNCFLHKNEKIKKIKLLNLRFIGDYFMYYNNIIKSIEIPSCEVIGNDFLMKNETLENCIANSVRSIGNNFLFFNGNMEQLELSRVTSIGDNFMNYGYKLNNFSAPLLENIGNDFLNSNCCLQELSLESLYEVGDNFIPQNFCIKKIYLPMLKNKGLNFLSSVDSNLLVK